MKLIALIHEESDGSFWAEVPSLPGCISGGYTRDETCANISEAAEGVLESIRKHRGGLGGEHTYDAPSIGDLFSEAEPEGDPQLYGSVLVHNYYQLFAKDIESIRSDFSDLNNPQLAELAV